MVEAVETLIENTQQSNCASSQQRGAEDQHLREVGNSTTKFPVEITDTRKRSSVTSPVKAPMEKRARLDACPSKGTESGAFEQNMQQEFPHNERILPHDHREDEGEGWAMEPHLSQA